jgi:hypothetical protein
MTATDLFLSLQSRGFTLSLDGSALLVSPPARITAEDREAIRQHKAGLVSLLGGQPEPKYSVLAPANPDVEDGEPNGDQYPWATYVAYRIKDAATAKILMESDEEIHDGHLAEVIAEYPAAVCQGRRILERKYRGQWHTTEVWETYLWAGPKMPWLGLA